MTVDLDNIETCYKVYRVRKPSGGWRTITEPNENLKQLQRNLAVSLGKDMSVSDFAFGFRKGFGCIDAAKLHTRKDWVLNIDVRDFFPSISEEHLPFLGEMEKKICLFRGGLPQGSPCSPVISNIVMKETDERLSKYFLDKGVCFSRYADDVTLSGFGRINIQEYVDVVSDELLTIGLKVNKRKTKFMPKYVRQSVLGIVVNDKISICKETRKNLRSALHHGNIGDKEEGLLSYVQMINKEQFIKLKERACASHVQT
jgi:hypothetical protein